MKKLSFLLMLFILSACNVEKPTGSTTANDQDASIETTVDLSKTGFDIDLKENVELDFEKMRIYPIVASEEHIAEHVSLAELKNLKEAMDIRGFRIMEKKPYGRQSDMDAVNTLTVQNKSTEDIYLMAGDVVKGGNQDRVLAQDMVLPPRTLTDINVFCVERNRWEYREQGSEGTSDAKAKSDRKMFAFSGYYNVVSNDIRRTVKKQKDQNKVWAAVNQLTATNKASTTSGTYTALENSKDYTNQRDRYLNYFTDKFDRTDDVIGIVVVSGNKVLGTDVFNHPDLFKKQYKVLLHSYVTDAITNGATVSISNKKMEAYSIKLKRNYRRDLGKEEADTKFRYNGKVVHFSHL